MMGLFKQSKPTGQKNYTTYQLMPSVSWRPKWSSFSRQDAVRHGYKRSTWVYSCVRLRANNVASVPWMVQVKGADGWESAPDNHPLTRLLRKPNPSFDWSDIIRMAVYNMDLSGDGWGSIIRSASGYPVELWPIIPDRMEVYPGRQRLVDYYKYHYSGVSKRLEPEEVLHLRYSNPGDLYYGLSPLEAAARAVDIDEEAEKWQKTSLQNMAVPPGLFALESDAGITQDQYEQARQFVSEQSGPENARKPWVLANAKYQQMGQSAVDLDYVNGRKFTREEICSAFSVPPPLVGIYENATLANIETARQILWKEGLLPVLDEIAGQLTLQLAQEFGDNMRITYDTSNVAALQQNYGEKIDTAEKMWRMGLPLTEINRRLELELELDDIAGSNVGYLPGGLLPTDFDIGEPIQGGNAAAADAFGGGEE